MATEIGELRARLTAEAQELKSEIRAVKQGFEELGEQGKKAATDIKSMDSALGQVGSSKDQINRLTSTLENVNAKIEIQRKKLAELKQSYDNTFDSSMKSKLQEQIVNTEGVLIRLTQTSDQTAQKIWSLEDSLNQAGSGGQQVATQMNALDDALKGIGLNSDQIKTIKRHLDEADPSKLDRQLDELSSALRRLGVDSKQIEKITNELRQSEQQSQKTKQGISGIASGLASLGAGAATVKLVNVIKSLANETNQLTNSYRGLSVVSDKFNVDSQTSIDLAEKLADRWGLNKGTIADTVKTYLTMNLTLEETEKLITATADAAAYNRQAHLSWDEAIKQVAEGIKSGNSNLTDAAGITTNLSIMQDRYAKSIGTTAAKLTEAQKIQASYNGIMQEAALFAGNADSAMTGYTGTQATFSQTLQTARVELGEAFLPVIEEIMDTLTPIISGFAEWASENKELVAALGTGIIAITSLITVITAATVVVRTLSAAFIGLNASMGVIGIAILAISALSAGISALVTSNHEAAEATRKHEEAQRALNETLNKADFSRTVEEVKDLQEKLTNLNPILEEHAKLQKKLQEIMAVGDDELQRNPELLGELQETNEKLMLLEKKVKELNFDSFEDAEKKAKAMKEQIEESIPALHEMERAELAGVAAKVQHIDKVNALVREYDGLNAKVKLSEEQKARLNSVVRDLVKEYPSLITQLDEENRWHITNRGSLDDLIGAEKDSVAASAQASKNRLSNWRTETEAKLKLAKLQIGALEKIEKFNFAESTVGKSLPSELGKGIEMIGDMVIAGIRNKAQSNANAFQQKMNDIDKDIQSITSGAFDKFLTTNSGGTTTNNKKSGKGKTGKTAAVLAREHRQEAYDAAIATVQYQAEMYDWSAEKQIEAYEKIRKQHKQHLAETIDDERQMNLQLKRLQEDTVKSKYDFSAEWISREDRRMEESGKTEIEIAQMKIDAWSRVRDRYNKDSEYYKDADDKLFQARKELISATEKAMKELYSSTSDFLKQQERKLEESGASETEIAQMKLTLWTRIRDSYAKDSEFYKQADEQVYQAKKNLISQTQKDNEAARKVEKQSITDAKKVELDAIAERRKAYTDDIDARIADIDRLIKAEDRLNAEQDYESQLAEQKARQTMLENAVSPEGRKEYADITAEIERMELEHSRDIRKQNLEDQKEALQDEKTERERAFDREREDAEKHYDALTDALENYQDDVKLMETGLQDYRVDANQTANTQILADLDSFVSAYNSKLASLTSLSGPSQQANDLQEYNSNKDAWDEAKARGDKDEMARLTARNDEIRRMYGIVKDTGRLDSLPSFDVGGVIPGPVGVPVPIIAHGGEIYLNPEQQTNLFRMLDSPKTTSGAGQAPVQPQQIIHNTFDMSVGSVTIEDQPDAEIMYTEREKAARRLATTGGGK